MRGIEDFVGKVGSLWRLGWGFEGIGYVRFLVLWLEIMVLEAMSS